MQKFLFACLLACMLVSVGLRARNAGQNVRVSMAEQLLTPKPRLHEHQVPNPDSNLDHNLHGRGGLSLDLNPVCLRVNATSLDQDLDQNARVNGAQVNKSQVRYREMTCFFFLQKSFFCNVHAYARQLPVQNTTASSSGLV